MNTPDAIAQAPRSEPSRLLETLLEICPEEHAGIIDPVALVFLMRAADQGSTVEERCRVASELAISGIGSIPDDASDALLRAVVRERFHGEPERGIGAGRIPLRYWRGRPWPWPFTTGRDGQSIVRSVDETSQLSLAVGVYRSEVDEPGREVHPIASALRSLGPNLHAERALRCVEAIVLAGDPAALLERRRRFLSHPELRGRPELGSWVMHAMDPADLESPRFFRDVHSADGIEWIARAAMALPSPLRRAVGRGLLPAFWHLLDDEDFPEPWAPEAAALLAITAPDLALRRADQITGARDLTPDDVEWLTGVALPEQERLAIAEAYSEPIRPREWNTKRRSLLLPGAPDLPGSEALNVLVRGKAGTVLELDLSVFDEPLDTEDGRLICPYDAFEILDLLRATGRLVPESRLARATARIRTVEIPGGWVYPKEDDDGTPDGS